MLILLNSAMMTREGFWVRKDLTTQDFKKIFEIESKGGFESYIGYPNACRVCSEILGVNVPLSREATEIKEGDVVLVLKLKYRVVVTEEKATRKHGDDISDYDFCLLRYFASIEDVEFCEWCGKDLAEATARGYAFCLLCFADYEAGKITIEQIREKKSNTIIF